MKPNRSLFAALFAAAALLPACGGDNPGTNFTIKDDLDDSIYVYNFDEAQVAVRYFANTNSVVAVADSYNGLFTVGIIGQPIGADSFQVLGAAVDTNNNNNFLDETLIPVTSNSSGVFSDNAQHLTMDVDVLVSGTAISFADRGNLDHTEDVPPL